MPLHIDIRVNHTLIQQFHIGRHRGGTNANDINEYLIVEGDRPTRFEDWSIDGVPFIHRYGDGAEVCVMKGIDAWKHWNEMKDIMERDEIHPPARFRDITAGE